MFSDTVHVSIKVMAQPIATRLIASPNDILLFTGVPFPYCTNVRFFVLSPRSAGKRTRNKANFFNYTFRYLFMLISVPAAPSSAPAAQLASSSIQRIESSGIRLKNPNICQSVMLSVKSENTEL